MRKKIGFLKNAIARLKGYYNPKGEKLVSAKLTQEECDVFNSQGITQQVVVEKVKARPEAPKTTTRKPRARKSDKADPADTVPETVEVVSEDVVETEAAVTEEEAVATEELPLELQEQTIAKEEKDSHGF